jgi:hypothetical protein
VHSEAESSLSESSSKTKFGLRAGLLLGEGSSGDAWGVWMIFRRFNSLVKDTGLFSWPGISLNGRNGLDWIPLRLLAGAVISNRACLDDAALCDP